MRIPVHSLLIYDYCYYVKDRAKHSQEARELSDDPVKEASRQMTTTSQLDHHLLVDQQQLPQCQLSAGSDCRF